MPERAKIGLDNPAFTGRLRRPEQRAAWSAFPDLSRSPVRAAARPLPPRPQVAPTPIIPMRPQPRPQPPAHLIPEAVQVQPAPVIAPAPVEAVEQPVIAEQFVQAKASPRPRRQTMRSQFALFGMAGIVFVAGLFVSVQGSLTNQTASAHVSALAASSSNNTSGTSDGSSPPSTVKPPAKTFHEYAVAPDLPRYLRIPKLGVNARVLQAGITSKGAMATPSNVYDTAWYTGSAKPGEKGATLIDGHVSSWTTHGVFYGIKNLKEGDPIQIVRGDNSLVTYRVVKTQTYDADSVDMQAAITPVTEGKSGLNLITCGGKVKPGTSEFTQRTIVFAEQL